MALRAEVFGGHGGVTDAMIILGIKIEPYIDWGNTDD